jgi:hypothetical protein
MRVVPAVLGLVLVFASTPATAQDTLRVLRHTPADTASPANVITITFDRPVAGLLDRTIPAERILRIQPAIAGKIEWRDVALWQLGRRLVVAVGAQGDQGRPCRVLRADALEKDIHRELHRTRHDLGELCQAAGPRRGDV